MFVGQSPNKLLPVESMPEFTIADLVKVLVGTNEKGVERGVPLLFPTDLDDFGRLVSTPQRFAPQSPAAEKACILPGDVLLPAKGFRLLATLVTEALSGSVASSSFYILRPLETSGIQAAYLAAYLNHPQGQQRLRAHIHTSTSVPVLNKADLLATKIPVPSHWKQMELMKLHALHQQRTLLARDLQHHNELLFHQAFQLGLLQT